MKQYEFLAALCDDRNKAVKSGDYEWRMLYEKNINSVMETVRTRREIDFAMRICESGNDRLVFCTSVRHSDHKWTYHNITLTPGLHSPALHVSGEDKNGIKDYIASIYLGWLFEDIGMQTYCSE